MSQISPSTPSSLTEGSSVTNLTLVVLLLIPCVLILLLLNCFFLGFKVLLLSKRRSRQNPEDTEDVLLRSTLPRLGDVVFSPLRDERTAYASLSHPVTSSRASSPRDRARFRLLRPDGATATGSGSLRAPSSIRAASPRLHVPHSSWARHVRTPGWCRSAPNLPQSSDESRVNLVPPNSPMEMEYMGPICRSSTYETLPDQNQNPSAAVPPFDKLVMECEYITPSLETSCLNTSAVGSGLDSDFGASAGVSLRILSADSDGLSNGVLSSALEWDYYDPCYVKQNNIPKHNGHRPVMHVKQYWV